MSDHQVVQRAEELINKGERLLQTARPSGGMSRGGRSPVPSTITGASYVDSGLWSEWRAQSRSSLKLVLADSVPSYGEEFEEYTQTPQHGSVERGIGVLRAVREDVAGGHLVRFREIVHADLFSDFLSKAEYLLSTGFKDPGAVLAGGVLEEHLRLLCTKNRISTEAGSKPKTAATMNSDLAREGVYDKNRQQIILAWLAIRNSAAHGKFLEYCDGDVERFTAGLREFITAYPA